MIKITHYYYSLVLMLLYSHQAFGMDMLTTLKCNVGLLTGYNVRSCIDPQINDFLRQQALLAGRDPNKAKIILTPNKSILYAAMPYGISDTIVTSEDEAKKLKFNLEFIKENSEECPDHPYLPYAYKNVAGAQGALLHEYGHCVWNKNRTPLQDLAFVTALTVSVPLCFNSEYIKAMYGQTTADVIGFCGAVYVGSKILQGSVYMLGYMSESNADTFVIKKLKHNIKQKNIERNKAIGILEETAHLFKTQAINNYQGSRSKGIIDRMKNYFSISLLDPHPADYTRYVKFQKAANELRKENTEALRDNVAMKTNLFKYALPRNWINNYYRTKFPTIETEQMLKDNNILKKDEEGTKRLQALRDSFQMKSKLFKYALPCNRINRLFYYYHTALPGHRKNLNTNMYPLFLLHDRNLALGVDRRFIEENIKCRQMQQAPYASISLKLER